MVVDGLGIVVDLDLQLVADDAQGCGINGDAFHFHGHQYGKQRTFDLVKNRFLPRLRELRAEDSC